MKIFWKVVCIIGIIVGLASAVMEWTGIGVTTQFGVGVLWLGYAYLFYEGLRRECR